MKKLLALCMALAVAVFAFAGCEPKSNKETGNVSPEKQEVAEETLAKSFSEADGISYVMIYNPNIYDETETFNDKLNTGDFGDYIEAVVNKADGLEMPELPVVMNPSAFETTKDVPLDKFDLSGGRAGAFIIPYKVGDTHEFYCGMEQRTLETFECKYAGEFCNVWTYNVNADASDIEKYGKEFDENVYEKVVEMFGEPRFADNGGKVNLLVYPMDGNTGGFFYLLDLFASGEVTPEQIDAYSVNVDHAIININSLLLDYEDYMYPTLAHEFQHLICGSNLFENYYGILMKTWLNEAMSGFVEEQLYPGAKDAAGHFEAFTTSSRIRHGQSMYNFDTTLTKSEFDIGVYGSVYLFSEYLAKLAGDDIYSKIHSHWRSSSNSTLNEAEAIVNAVSPSVYDNINNSVEFGNIAKISDKNEEWLSKLTLNFYLSLLKLDENDPEAYEKVKSQTLLYDEINPADIEGGGRVIVALKDGEFEIPSDADDGFVYVGLDNNFEVITEFIVQ